MFLRRGKKLYFVCSLLMLVAIYFALSVPVLRFAEVGGFDGGPEWLRVGIDRYFTSIEWVMQKIPASVRFFDWYSTFWK